MKLEITLVLLGFLIDFALANTIIGKTIWEFALSKLPHVRIWP